MVIPTVVILIILALVIMVWYIRLAIHSDGAGSFSAWLRNVTITGAASLVVLTAVGMYVHFPIHLCEQCRRSTCMSTAQNELQPLHAPERNYSTETKFSSPHSTVTTETTPLIPHASKVGHHNDHSYTSFSIDIVAQVLACPLNSHYKPITIHFLCGFV